MTRDHEPAPAPRGLPRFVRVIVPWIGLAVVIGVLWSLVSDYRATLDSGEATKTVETTAQAGSAEGQPYVLVLSDGLNLRSEPSTSAPIVKVLDGNQQLALIEEGAGWYHVRDAAGTEGWVAAGGRYTELVEP